MKAPGRDVVKRPAGLDEPVTIVGLERDAQYLAYVVKKYGEVYRPILDRLNAELEAIRRRQGLDEVSMPRTAAKVTQADIARAIRAMQVAGYPDVRVVFENGAVIVEPAPKGSKAAPETKRDRSLKRLAPWPDRSGPITVERVERATEFEAYVAKKYGNQCVPILGHLTVRPIA